MICDMAKPPTMPTSMGTTDIGDQTMQDTQNAMIARQIVIPKGSFMRTIITPLSRQHPF